MDALRRQAEEEDRQQLEEDRRKAESFRGGDWRYHTCNGELGRSDLSGASYNAVLRAEADQRGMELESHNFAFMPVNLPDAHADAGGGRCFEFRRRDGDDGLQVLLLYTNLYKDRGDGNLAAWYRPEFKIRVLSRVEY
jgi:hypothetical protein